MKQIIIIILAVVMGLLVAMELGLRSLFGFGNPLIQDKTISSLLMNSLISSSHTQQLEVLNASANSWSPHNELAYLQKF